MNIRVHCRNFRKTQLLTQHVDRRLASLERRFKSKLSAISIDFVRIDSKFFARCRLRGVDAPLVKANDFEKLACIDAIFDKIESSLRRRRDKRVRRKKRTKPSRLLLESAFQDPYLEVEAQNPFEQPNYFSQH